MRNRSSLTMSAIVVGTYICALVGATGLPTDARAVMPAKPAVRTPATRPAWTVPVTGWADVSVLERE